jgi:hypothetical protein
VQAARVSLLRAPSPAFLSTGSAAAAQKCEECGYEPFDSSGCDLHHGIPLELPGIKRGRHTAAEMNLIWPLPPTAFARFDARRKHFICRVQALIELGSDAITRRRCRRTSTRWMGWGKGLTIIHLALLIDERESRARSLVSLYSRGQNWKLITSKNSQYFLSCG